MPETLNIFILGLYFIFHFYWFSQKDSLVGLNAMVLKLLNQNLNMSDVEFQGIANKDSGGTRKLFVYFPLMNPRDTLKNLEYM